MIQLEQLEAMFANIAAGAKWDMNRPMLWGYFFTDRSREKLQTAATALVQHGYRVVDVFVPDLDEEEDEYFFLHVGSALARVSARKKHAALRVRRAARTCNL
jgi:hypothetical protein